MAQPAEQRPVLGQWAELGSLYDARTERFVPFSLFNCPTPPAAIRTVSQPSNDIRISHTDSYGDKFNNLRVGPELGASFLSGLLNVDGSALYLTESRDSNLVEQASLHYIITTVQETLNFGHHELSRFLDHDVLQKAGATHVLVGIIWGSQTIISVKQQFSSPAEQARVPKNVQTQVKKMEQIAITGHPPEFEDSSTAQRQEFSPEIHVYSDFLKTVGRDTDFRRVHHFIANLSSIVASTQNGKGLPLSYSLLPLANLTFLGIDIQADVGIRPLNPDCLRSFVSFFDEMRTAKQNLNDYTLQLSKHRFCVPPQFIQTVTQCKENADVAEATLRSNYADSLREVRAGGDPEQLRRLLGNARRGLASPKDITNLTTQFREKMELADKFIAKGVRYFGYEGLSLDQELSNPQFEEVYVFHFNEKIRRDRTSWDENEQLLDQLLHQQRTRTLIAMADGDAIGTTLRKCRISQYRQGRLMYEDLHDQMTTGECFTRHISPKEIDSKAIEKPQRRSAVRIACPFRLCSRDMTYDWICQACDAPLEYGYKDGKAARYIYCDCGRSPYTNFAFKCRGLTHGPGFEQYDKRLLAQLLDSLDPLDTLNVLILGETGVGKSTFINAFLNYLTFDTLDESIQDPKLNWVIPCSFNVQNMDRSTANGKIRQRHIKIGEDDDEKDGSTGISATQQTKVYPVILGNTIVRLIDTPGIGDTRGIEQDRENMANILLMLRNFDKLHGILILLKSNDSRLTVMFRFCVKELLTHLHRDAARNMVFGFTNTRISNYMPGDTFTPLESLLNEHNDVGIELSSDTIYCFDSESFRFLAAQKNGITMDNIQEFRSSWAHSRAETTRLLEYFRSLQPHHTRSTLSLNRTRDLIMHLTRPMADIMQNIDKTIQLNKDAVSELSETQLKGDELRKRRHWAKIEMVHHDLDKPRTVCNDVECKEYRDDGSGAKLTIYKSHCHVQCYMTGVPAETLSCAELTKCTAFKGQENCTVCGHHWQHHLHVQFELEETTVQAEDETVVELLKKNASDITIKEALIKSHNEKIKEFEAEHREIQAAAVRFGLFLKNKSITPYNDAMLSYLDHLIKDETEKVNYGDAPRTRLDTLLRHRLEYDQQIKVLTTSMKAGKKEELLDEDGVDRLVDKLYGLKHWGQNLRKIKDDAEATHHNNYRERAYRLPGKGGNSRNSRQKSATSSTYGAVSWLAGQVPNNFSIANTSTGRQNSVVVRRPMPSNEYGHPSQHRPRQPPPQYSVQMPGSYPEPRVSSFQKPLQARQTYSSAGPGGETLHQSNGRNSGISTKLKGYLSLVR